MSNQSPKLFETRKVDVADRWSESLHSYLGRSDNPLPMDEFPGNNPSSDR